MMHSAFVSSLGFSWSFLGAYTASFSDVVRPSLLHLIGSTGIVSSNETHYPEALAVEHSGQRTKLLWKIFSGSSVPDSIDDYLASGVSDIMGRLNKRSVQSTLTSIESSKLYDVTMRDVVSSYEPHLVPYYLARFLSGSCRESALWSSVIPTEPVFSISPAKYSFLLAYQLGSRLPGSQQLLASCDCGASLATDRLHVFGCERRYPHDRIKVQLHKFCQAAGLVPTLEPLHTCHGACQPDIAIPDLDSDGKTMLVDFTTADPGAACYLNRGSHRSYHVAWKLAEKAKMDKYSGQFDAGAYAFAPLAMEIPGRWSAGLFKFFGRVKSYARLNRIQDPVRHSAFVGHWRKVLCVVFRVAQVICVESLFRSLLSGTSMAIVEDAAV